MRNRLNTQAERLRWIRKDSQMTQEEIASDFHLSRSAYTRKETGDGVLTNSQLSTLGKKFGINLNWFVNGVGRRKRLKVEE